MSIAEFAPLFSGPLASHAGALVLASETPPQAPGTDLADPDRLAEKLALFARHYPGGDPRAVASIWSKAHFSVLLTPFLALSLVMNRVIDVDLHAIGCSFGPDGDTQRFHLADTGKNADDTDPFGRFAGLMDGHIAPLAAALSKLTGLSRNVVWSNAGNRFEFFVRRVEAFTGRTGPVSQALGLMEERRLPDGRPNPLFRPVLYREHDGRSIRQRRICCIRYLLAETDLCSTCPLPEKPR